MKGFEGDMRDTFDVENEENDEEDDDDKDDDNKKEEGKENPDQKLLSPADRLRNARQRGGHRQPAQRQQNILS